MEGIDGVNKEGIEGVCNLCFVIMLPYYIFNKRLSIVIVGVLLLLLAINNIVRPVYLFKPKWDYFPTNRSNGEPLYGIVMAGTTEKFRKNLGLLGSDQYVSPCISKLYAMKHNYAFALIENLEDINYRKYPPCNTFPQWNKVKVMEMYIMDVDILLWIDLDAVIAQFDTPLTAVLPNNMAESACSSMISDVREFGRGITSQDRRDLPGAANESFFWATADINAAEYDLNLNTAVMALRRGPMARTFLKLLWDIGDNPEAFQRHDKKWRKKKQCKGYYGWPWEQGGVWDVLLNKSHVDMLRGTCMLPHVGPKALNSILDYWKDGEVHPGRPFITHKPHLTSAEVLRAFSRNFDVNPAVIRQHCHRSVAAIFSS